MAAYRPAFGVCYVRAVFGVGQENHVHLECRARQLVPIGGRHKPPSRKKDVLTAFEDFQEANLRSSALVGTFVVPPDGLPSESVIRAMSEPLTVGGVSVRLSEGVFSIEGTPVSAVSWWLDEDSGEFYVRLIAAGDKDRLVGSCMVEALDLLNRHFKVLVMHEEP